MDVSCHPLHETKVGKNSWSVQRVWWPPNWGQIPSAVEGLGRSRLDFQLLVSTRFRQNPRDYPWICVSSNLDYEHTTKCILEYNLCELRVLMYFWLVISLPWEVCTLGWCVVPSTCVATCQMQWQVLPQRLAAKRKRGPEKKAVPSPHFSPRNMACKQCDAGLRGPPDGDYCRLPQEPMKNNNACMRDSL